MSTVRKQRKIRSALGRLLQKIAPEVSVRIVLEPEWGVVGKIIFNSGRISYFKYNTIDLNPLGASAIAADKDYTHYFLQDLGYPIVPGSRTFFSKEWGEIIGVEDRTIEHAYAYAKSIGFPVFVKPNSGSQGNGVALVYTKQEFYRAMRTIFAYDRVALVQQPVTGKDYRLVVLDNEVISAYERIPLSVVGTGKHTVKALLSLKQLEFVKKKRDTLLSCDDPRIRIHLGRKKMTLDSVIPKGVRISLLDNANLSTGGDSKDVTSVVHPDFRRIAIELTRSMGLRLCGLDLMVDGDITEAPSRYWVLEINSSPGLDHYARSGKKQQRIVENFYKKVIRALDQ